MCDRPGEKPFSMAVRLSSLTRDGTIYFASDRDPSGRSQIYRAKLSGEKYEAPEKLGPEINSDFNDSEPFVSADESLLFLSLRAKKVLRSAIGQTRYLQGVFPYARRYLREQRRKLPGKGDFDQTDRFAGANQSGSKGPQCPSIGRWQVARLFQRMRHAL
jgi:hypothetical protein